MIGQRCSREAASLNIERIGDLIENFVSAWEQMLSSPRSFFASTEIDGKEALAFLSLNVFFSAVLMAATSLLYFYLYFPDAFASSAEEGFSEDVQTLFKMVGAFTASQVITAVIAGLIGTLVTRALSKQMRASQIFPRMILPYGFELLAGIPTAILVLTDSRSVIGWSSILLIRGAEFLFGIIALRYGVALTGIRLALGILFGWLIPTTLLVFMVTTLTWMFVGIVLIPGWD
jgi:hypothetical protein